MGNPLWTDAPMMWILMAWGPVLWMLGSLFFALRLLYVPAGRYRNWRLAWIGLMLTNVSIGILFLRNALVLSGLTAESSLLVQVLLSVPARIMLTNIGGWGLLGCSWQCWRIFREHITAGHEDASE